MNISVFGLGYVGAVCCACLAREGHNVIGVDVSRDKVDILNAGRSPIVERDLPGLIETVSASGALRATTDAALAVRETDLSLICVGTPSRDDGEANLDFVRKVCVDIGRALRAKTVRHTVVMRSTVLPGTVRGVVVPTLESASGKRAGPDFGVAANPEFLREGSAIHDFFHPPKTVIGEFDSAAADQLASLYADLDAPLLRLPLEAAEMVKFADNAWHAAKVAFANEIGNICKGVGVDGHTVMDAFCQDHKLNLSPAYLRPGFAFGGSCLPKDLRALCHKAASLELATPVLDAILPSNRNQIERARAMVRARPGRRVALLGLSFKPGTDDLRESPLVELARALVEDGYDLRIHDANVVVDHLTGVNRSYVLERLPELPGMLSSDLAATVDAADILVVGNPDKAYAELFQALCDPAPSIIDLVRMSTGSAAEGYEGICW